MSQKSILALAFAAVALSSGAFGQSIPRPAKDLELQSPAGSKIKLSQFKGQNVVVAFLLTT